MGWASGFDAGTRASKQWIDSYDASQQEIDAKKIYGTQATETPQYADVTDADRQRFDQYNAGIAAQDNATFGDGSASADDLRYGLQNQKQTGSQYSIGDPERGGLRQDTQFTPAQLNAWRAGQMADSLASHGDWRGSVGMRASQQALEKGDLDMQVGRLGLKTATRADEIAMKLAKINQDYLDHLTRIQNGDLSAVSDMAKGYNTAHGQGGPMDDGHFAGFQSTPGGTVINKFAPDGSVVSSTPVTPKSATKLAGVFRDSQLAALDPEYGLKLRTAGQKDTELDQKATQHTDIYGPNGRFNNQIASQERIAAAHNATTLAATRIVSSRKESLNPLQQRLLDDQDAFRKEQLRVTDAIDAGTMTQKQGAAAINRASVKFGGPQIKAEHPVQEIKPEVWLAARDAYASAHAKELKLIEDPARREAIIKAGTLAMLDTNPDTGSGGHVGSFLAATSGAASTPAAPAQGGLQTPSSGASRMISNAFSTVGNGIANADYASGAPGGRGLGVDKGAMLRDATIRSAPASQEVSTARAVAAAYENGSKSVSFADYLSAKSLLAK